MFIGLLSDTHIAHPSETLPSQIKDAFRDVDLILHAGDIWIPSVLDELESIAPVKAAWGDDDLESDFDGDNRMMTGYAFHLDGVTLWLTHIKPSYALVNPYAQANPKVHLFNPRNGPSSSEPSPEALGGLPDVVVFGHTHSPIVERYKGVLLVNPGSPTLPNADDTGMVKRYVAKLGTVALLTINSGKVEARLIPLE